MRFIVLFFILAYSLFASEYKLKLWESGLTFVEYLNKFKIDANKFYNKVAPDDIRFLSAIEGGAPYFESVKNGVLQETLIPLGEEMQIYVYKKNNEYNFDIVPIEYKTVNDTVFVKIQTGCYKDLKKAVNNPHIATYLKRAFNGAVDFTKLQKGDSVIIKYSQKAIDGLAWGEPNIEAAYVKHKNADYFAIKGKDGYKVITNDNIAQASKQVQQKVKLIKKSSYIAFTKPLSNIRITSKFTYKRWHPILHRYRPHLGVDFGAKRGTPIYAIASGKVVYAGWMRGYGKVTKISHGGGYISLYAHQSRINVKVGQMVKAHQKIGAIGSTGRSTGPHLHLGVYKNGKPINPMRVVNKIVKTTTTVVKKVVVNLKNISTKLTINEKIVYNSLKKVNYEQNKPHIWRDFDKSVTITIKRDNKDANRIKLRSKQGAA